jgi:hypothetical protein
LKSLPIGGRTAAPAAAGALPAFANSAAHKWRSAEDPALGSGRRGSISGTPTGRGGAVDRSPDRLHVGVDQPGPGQQRRTRHRRLSVRFGVWIGSAPSALATPTTRPADCRGSKAPARRWVGAFEQRHAADSKVSIPSATNSGASVALAKSLNTTPPPSTTRGTCAPAAARRCGIVAHHLAGEVGRQKVAWTAMRFAAGQRRTAPASPARLARSRAPWPPPRRRSALRHESGASASQRRSASRSGTPRARK